MTHRLFISYRRADSVAITGRIYDRLVAEFGRDDVFKDVDSIGFGDFRKTIQRALSGCHVVMVVIGSKWLEMRNEAGEPRLDHGSDPVRIEIAAALQRMREHDDVFVVPLLVDGASMPKPELMPEDIRDLVYQNGFRVRHDPDFHGDIDKLIKRVRAAYPRLGGPASEPPPANLRATSRPSAKLPPSPSSSSSSSSPSSSSSSSAPATPAVPSPPTRPTPQQRVSKKPDSTSPMVKSGDTSAGAVRVQPLAMVRVPDGFTRLRSEPYSCGGAKNTVAVYRFEPFARALGLTDGRTHPAAEFALVPGGVFEMGSPDNEEGRRADESPRRRVTVPSFLIGRTPITQRVWRALASEPETKGVGRGMLGDWVRGLVGAYPPIENVAWSEAMMWCISLGLRLPTEAEWEYACRAGTTTRFSFGSDVKKLVEYAWFDENSNGQLQSVAQKKPNAFGLLDMHGCVWEWCHDTHGDYTYAPLDGSAAEVFGAHSRVVRGGGWGGPSVSCRSADRYWLQSETRNPAVGFRAACSLPA